MDKIDKALRGIVGDHIRTEGGQGMHTEELAERLEAMLAASEGEKGRDALDFALEIEARVCNQTWRTTDLANRLEQWYEARIHAEAQESERHPAPAPAVDEAAQGEALGPHQPAPLDQYLKTGLRESPIDIGDGSTVDTLAPAPSEPSEEELAILGDLYDAGVRQGKWLVMNSAPNGPVYMQPDRDKVIAEIAAALRERQGEGA